MKCPDLTCNAPVTDGRDPNHVVGCTSPWTADEIRDYLDGPTILHLERSDGDPCAMVDGHVPIDKLNERYRLDLGLTDDDHDDEHEWHHRWYTLGTNEFGDEVFNWTAASTDAGAKPCTIWEGP